MTASPSGVSLTASCAPAAVAISNYSNYEGTGQGVRSFTFLVAVTPAAGCTATGSVQVHTSNGTAQAPGDFQATTTTVSWNGGTAPRTVTVPVIADSTAENDEGFTVVLTNPVNLVITKQTGFGAVLDDDDPPQRTGVDGGKICWAIDRGTNSEQTCRVAIRTNLPARAPITVHFRTIALDKPVGYEPVRDGLITIPVGSTTGVAEIKLLPGPRPAEERFVFELFDPSAGVLDSPRTVVTILAK
ncbi:Calx-beta domain-containing protein [Actinokineospora fastidiosa]|uniref:Calx-beta domain-containing protein n=1 Tax=Actinokineospora fastidiosa TaxID=1816 RepID=UPI0016716D53|nr:Calx-beta domain-containing protein [Actinokineospora fastidiosa]